MDYQIYDREIWENVIRQLIDSKCVRFLYIFINNNYNNNYDNNNNNDSD